MTPANGHAKARVIEAMNSKPDMPR